ncbi:MAG TPA: 23S ribosomal RNA methyltransferase Erm [Natronosporangium sp.]|nr:23S ribosomal RNA methyltransferase Erm [Natronosporangium sp.]
MPYYTVGGAAELGQNFLVDPTVITTIVGLVARTSGPVVEIGAGAGALTLPLARTGRLITAVEIHPALVSRLRRRAPTNVTVVCADFLRWRPPTHPYTLVGNLPFHLTTALLRRILASDHWRQAVLLVQWEVARRRAGVGGASLLTSAWWPWYEFRLHARVPARAFRPVPGVDGGLLTITRRGQPLVTDRAGYQTFVRSVFTGRGRGLPAILARTGRFDPVRLREWLRRHRIDARTLPSQLDAEQWAELWRLAASGQRPRMPSPIPGQSRPRPAVRARRRTR